MKKIRVRARVYDHTTKEYVQKMVDRPISDELAKMLQEELHNADYKSYGHGCGEDSKKRLPYNTPLASQRRFTICPEFFILDEEGNSIGGWEGV